MNKTDTRYSWIAFAISTIISLIVYSFTLAPTVTLDQSGALACAGDTLGIGRVPGYPVWHLSAKLFSSIFSFVKYNGQPNPAWGINFMSAFYGSLSCGLIAFIVSKSGNMMLKADSNARRHRLIIIASAVSSSLLFGFSNAMWSQSVITETHTLTLFAILSFMALSQDLIIRENMRTAYALALIFGIGIAQSTFLALLIPVGFFAVFFIDKYLSILFLALSLIIHFTIHYFIRHYQPTALNIIPTLSAIALLLLLSFVFIPKGKNASILSILILVGLLFYFYLPLSSKGNAPMSFGYPQTWEGFTHVIYRGQYAGIKTVNIFETPLLYAKQLQWYFGILVSQFTLPISLAGLLGLFALFCQKTRFTKWAAIIIVAYIMFTFVCIFYINPERHIQDSIFQRIRFIPSFALFSVLIGCGFIYILNLLTPIPND